MVRTLLVVVGDDQSVIQKSQQFAQMNGLSTQVISNEQWDNMNAKMHAVPSLVPGGASGSESGKVLQFPVGGQGTDKKDVHTINDLESRAITEAIAAFRGNLTEAAKALGIGRATLYRKVKQYNIDPSASRKKKAA